MVILYYGDRNELDFSITKWLDLKNTIFSEKNRLQNDILQYDTYIFKNTLLVFKVRTKGALSVRPLLL